MGAKAPNPSLKAEKRTRRVSDTCQFPHLHPSSNYSEAGIKGGGWGCFLLPKLRVVTAPLTIFIMKGEGWGVKEDYAVSSLPCGASLRRAVKVPDSRFSNGEA